MMKQLFILLDLTTHNLEGRHTYNPRRMVFPGLFYIKMLTDSYTASEILQEAKSRRILYRMGPSNSTLHLP